MQNRPFNVIDPETGKETVIWQSRSTAVVGVIFVKNYIDGEWYVLANQRGDGTPNYQGYWNCPAGFIDYNETGEQAVKREIFEETGLEIPIKDIKFYKVNTDFSDDAQQTIGLRYYAVLKGHINEWKNFSLKNMEPGEVKDIQWIPICDLEEYKWAFNHKEIIKHAYKNYVDISSYKRMILNIYNMLFNN